MSRLGCFRKWWLGSSLVALIAVAATGEALAKDESPTSYTVKAGDSLGQIAVRHGVSLELLRKVNGISGDRIRAGQKLLLPTSYEVQPGDVLGTIAERFGIKLSELYRLNQMNEKSVLKVGQRIVIAGSAKPKAAPAPSAEPRSPQGATEPAKKTETKDPDPRDPDVEYYRHEVRLNEVLSAIAKRYAVSARELTRINRLGNGSLIRVGQKLDIPVTDANAHLTRPHPWSKYARRPFERGKVTLKAYAGEWTGRVFDAKGNVLPEARQRIQSMLASWETGKKVQVPIDPRLYELIVTVSDAFGGRPIRVVSGYRQSSYARHSKHRLGRALDFSIPGVPNSDVVDFLLTLPNTGVGYYPNSTHVHVDARGSRMYWVDVSGPGQAPRYVHKSNKGERAPVASLTKPAKRRSASPRSDGERMARLDPGRR